MLNVSRSLPDIAVLRGGKEEFSLSLEEGQDVLRSLSKLGYKPLDVVVDREGEWTAQGIPTDAHMIFSRAHTVVDTTRDRHSPHIKLAKRMGVSLLFSKGNNVNMDREDMYRILRMQGVKVPDTFVVRAKTPLRDSLFREVWSTYHTPLMIRPLVRRSDAPSQIVSMYPEFERVVREYHDRGIDIHILTYKKVPTSSLAVLPNFRGEKLYMPLWVETFARQKEIPNPKSVTRVYQNAPEWRRQQIKAVVEKVYDAAGLAGPAVIDVISYNNEYIVVNIEERPSLTKNGRFMQSLKSTGVDLGQYVHSQIKDEFEASRSPVFDSQLSEYDLAR